MKMELVTVADRDFKRELDRYLEGVTGVVEATDFERQCLWQLHTDHGRKWESSGHGLMCGVGKLADMPITISLITATVDGEKILFFDSPSRVVDHRQVDAWLVANMPESARRDGRINRSDATNFHNVLRR